MSTREVIGLLIAAVLGLWLAATKIDANGYDRAEAEYKAKILGGNIAHSKALLAYQQAVNKRLEAQSKNALRQSELLIAASATIETQKRQLNERAKEVSTQYRERPDSALKTIPGWVVTNGWLCDYNRAYGVGLSSAAGTGAADGGVESPACSADPFGTSGVTGEEILRHHEDYGSYCRRVEVQRDRLIDHIEFIEGKPIK